MIGSLRRSDILAHRRSLYLERDRRNTLLRKVPWIYHHGPTALQYVLGITWLVLLTSVGPQDFSLGIISLIAVALIIISFRYSDEYRLLSRAILYSASILSTFAGVYQVMTLSVNVGFEILWVDLFLLILIMMLGLSIRMTRRELFPFRYSRYFSVIGAFIGKFFSGQFW